ncbi:coiled-coil domain-containing protein 14 isoform X2 [Syngnathus scovelli]|uniref:coiled-coil domain-containing protein 14 isoform X2 n=1 Tax=Syngnathus scovelli TaxID=161590 RepID=UPI00210FE602|nr:coiled-coil domain-containing protein 14 isoform X2 [Syngnathus scovelli]
MKFLSNERKCETKGSNFWKGNRWRSQEPHDQIASLHSGLDRCAVLLSGMLQVDKEEPSTKPSKAVNGGAAKPKPSAGLGKKSGKKFPPTTGGSQKEHRSKQVPKAKYPPGTQVGAKKAHPPARQSHLLPSPKESHPPRRSAPNQPLNSVLLSVTQSESAPHSTPPSSQRPHTQTTHQPGGGDHRASFNGKDIDSVPVKDTDIQSETHQSVHNSDKKIDAGQPYDTHARSEEEDIGPGKLRTVQYLLGELKTLIAGKGSIAEKLLSHLELTVSSPQLNSKGSDPEKSADLQALHNLNAQLHKRVEFLNKELKERTRQLNIESLCQVVSVPEDLAATQRRLQELQVVLAEVRKCLLDTKKQLRDSEAENALMKSELETLKTKLVQSQQEKNELAILAQQRLERIENLKQTIRSRNISEFDTVVDLAVSDAALKDQYDDPNGATERITKYLMTLGQPEVSYVSDNVHMAAEREEKTPDEVKMTQRETPPSRPNHCDQTHSEGLAVVQLSEQQTEKERRKTFDSFLSEGKVDTLTPDCSMRSVSTFDTRDEAAFRDGLAALDASIASLQKTIKRDLSG